MSAARSGRQVWALTTALLTAWANRRLAELSLPAVSRRTALAGTGAVVALGVVVVLAAAVLVAGVLPALPGTVSRWLLAAAAIAPWLVGSLSQRSVGATLGDPNHSLVRPALVNDAVLVVARVVLPCLATVLGWGLGIGAAAAVALGAGPLEIGAAAVAWLGYALVVLAARIALLAWRLRLVAAVRRGRVGIGVLVAAAVAQALAAFALPHAIVRVGVDRVGGVAGAAAEALGRHGGALVVAGLVAALAAPVLAWLATRALDRGIRGVEAELRAAQFALSGSTAATGPLPADPVRALLHKDLRRIRRLGGPLISPALGTVSFGTTTAAFVLGCLGSGLVASGSRLGDALWLGLTAIFAMEVTSAGVRPITSPDADGSAGTLVTMVPGGLRALVRAKTRLHAVFVAAALGSVLVLLVLGPTVASIPAVSGAALLAGGIVISVVEHITGPARYPRRDWTNVEQIGGNAKALTFGFTVSAVGCAVVMPMVLMAGQTLDPAVTSPALAAVIVASACGLALWISPRVSTLLIGRNS